MGMVAAKNFRVHHAREDDIVGKLRLAGALRPRINLAKWFANYFEWLSVFRIVRHHNLNDPQMNTDGHGFKHMSLDLRQIMTYL